MCNQSEEASQLLKGSNQRCSANGCSSNLSFWLQVQDAYSLEPLLVLQNRLQNCSCNIRAVLGKQLLVKSLKGSMINTCRKVLISISNRDKTFQEIMYVDFVKLLGITISGIIFGWVLINKWFRDIPKDSYCLYSFSYYFKNWTSWKCTDKE